MIFRIFGHQPPREPLLFLLWMTLALTSCEFGAIRLHAADLNRSPRKSTHAKRDDANIRATSLQLQGEFPYRFVFPANHPYSSFTQFLSPPPTSTGTAYSNSYQPTYVDLYSHEGHNLQHQQYLSSQPEYKYVMKQQQQPHQQQPQQQQQPPPQPSAYQQLAAVNTHLQQTYTPNYQTPLPYAAPAAPMILLLQPSHTGTTTNGPFQTFVLIPTTDGSHQGVNTLAVPAHGYSAAAAAAAAAASLPQMHQLAAQPPQPYSNIGVQASPNVLPITSSPMLFRPSHYSKSSNNAPLSGLLHRPINVYPMPTHKYYPQKKSSLEPRTANPEKESSSNKRIPTSTEANLGYLTSRS